MNIQKYAPYFHDGILENILCANNEVHITMTSAEITPEDELDAPLLKGILHIQKVNRVQVTGSILLDDLMQTFDKGIILDFEYVDHNVMLGILWENRYPKPRTNEFTTINIIAEHIWWENLPNLS